MADTDKAYIGIERCGCVTFVSVAGIDSERQERAELKRVIKSGRRIEVTTVADARGRWTHCEHGGPEIEDETAELDRLLSEGRHVA